MPPTSTLAQLVVASCLLGVAAVSASESGLALRVGADQQGGNAFEGETAAVRFHRRALSATELATLAAQQPAAVPTIPPAWEWRHASEFDARIVRTGQVESVVTDGVACVRFRGGFLQAITPPPALDGDFTIDGWVRPAREGATARLVDRITPFGSWQGAFPASTFARLGEGDRVCEILAKHFQVISNPNLTAGFSQAEWEIDGNLGVMAAIGEMLLESHAGEIELLPAPPKTWLDGSVQGLKARANVTVDLNWKEGNLTGYRLRSPEGTPVRVRVGSQVTTVIPDRAL